MKKSLIFLFLMYTYFLNIGYMLMELLPPFIRNVLFKVSFRNLGKMPLIDYKTYFRFTRRISIGSNVAINRGCEFYASFMVKAGTITIGDNVTFSPNVRLYAIAHDHRGLEMPDFAAPIVIESHAWIAADSIILPGVTIGEGAVIGAGSVVTRDIPPYSVAVGSPARVIKPRDISSEPSQA